MKTYDLLILGSPLSIIVDDEVGILKQGLPREIRHCETCPTCGKVDEAVESERELFDHFLDTIESVALAHACAGIDISDPAYVEGLETAVDGAINNY